MSETVTAKIGRSTLLDNGPLTKPIHIRIDPQDLEFAEQLAHDRYGNNLSMVLRLLIAEGVAKLRTYARTQS